MDFTIYTYTQTYALYLAFKFCGLDDNHENLYH